MTVCVFTLFRIVDSFYLGEICCLHLHGDSREIQSA
jgi:hypothetical protein